MKLFTQKDKNGDIKLTIIGYGSSVSGNIKSTDDFRIDGEFEGNIETSGTIIIAPRGNITGNLKASYIKIMGKVEGDVRATKECLVVSGGFLTGHIFAQKADIQDSAYFNGKCIICKDVNGTQTEKAKLTVPKITSSKQNKLQDEDKKIPALRSNDSKLIEEEEDNKSTIPKQQTNKHHFKNNFLTKINSN